MNFQLQKRCYRYFPRLSRSKLSNFTDLNKVLALGVSNTSFCTSNEESNFLFSRRRSSLAYRSKPSPNFVFKKFWQDGHFFSKTRNFSANESPLPKIPSVSLSSLGIVGTTLPLVAAAGTKFTGHFYERLFKAHPELLNIFNLNNQRNGTQKAALFGAIARAATSLLSSGKLPMEMLEGICQKHCALYVVPAHYDVVGEHIIGTIVDMLDPGETVLNAWGQLYLALAGNMMHREEEIYRQVESRSGGWRGTRSFIVKSKERKSDNITSFYMVPKDGKPVCSFSSGQYITVWLHPKESEYRQPRHYSITNSPGSETSGYSIAVRKVTDGLISSYLHDQVKEGDEIELSPPMGDFTIQGSEHIWTTDAPVVLISAGVGMTPMLSMLHSLEDHKLSHAKLGHKVLWLHGARNGKEHAFRDYIVSLSHDHPDEVTRRVWYSEANADDIRGENNAAKYHFDGNMELGSVKSHLPLHDERAQYYYCGPLPFMQNIQSQLTDFGVPKASQHYEAFGPGQEVMSRQ